MVAAIARCDPLAALACVEEGASADEEDPVSGETILVAAARTACTVARHVHRARGRTNRQVEAAAQARRAKRRRELAHERADEVATACVDHSLRAATEGRVWAPSPAVAVLERMQREEEGRSGSGAAGGARTAPGSRPASKQSLTTAAATSAPQSRTSTRSSMWASTGRRGEEGEEELGVVALLDRSGSSGQGSASRPVRPTLDRVARWAAAQGRRCHPVAHRDPAHSPAAAGTPRSPPPRGRDTARSFSPLSAGARGAWRGPPPLVGAGNCFGRHHPTALRRVNFSPPRGAPALVWAARSGHEAAVEALLARGADATLKDGEGRSAFDWAIAGGFPAVIRLLALAKAQTTLRPAFELPPRMAREGVTEPVLPCRWGCGAMLIGARAAEDHEEQGCPHRPGAHAALPP